MYYCNKLFIWRVILALSLYLIFSGCNAAQGEEGEARTVYFHVILSTDVGEAELIKFTYDGKGDQLLSREVIDKTNMEISLINRSDATIVFIVPSDTIPPDLLKFAAELLNTGYSNIMLQLIRPGRESAAIVTIRNNRFEKKKP